MPMDGELQIGSTQAFVEMPERVVLPAGEYDAYVKSYKIERYTPGPTSKLTACNMVKVTIEAQGAEGQTAEIEETLFLHQKCLSSLSAFFASVELVDQNGQFALDFNPAVSRRCRVALKIRSYTTKNGKAGQSNAVDRWFPPPTRGYSVGVSMPQAQPQAQPAYQWPNQTQTQPQTRAPGGWSGGGFPG